MACKNLRIIILNQTQKNIYILFNYTQLYKSKMLAIVTEASKFPPTSGQG